MTLKAAERRLDCKITGVGESTNGTPVLVVTASESKYPINLDMDDDALAYLKAHIGDDVPLIVSPKKTKANKADDGFFNNYYWKVVGELTPESGEAASPQPKQPPASPQNSPQRPQGAPQGLTSKDMSIERQVALYAARAGAWDIMQLDPEIPQRDGVTVTEAYTKLVGQLYRGMVKLLREEV
jgi:hypothetical protein